MNKKLITLAGIALATNAHSMDLWDDLTGTETGLVFEKSLLDTPFPVSVITFEDIEAYNIQSLEEALMLFPGMANARSTYTDALIGYHEISPINPRRMLVVIDDIPVNDSLVQNITWWNLPITIDDVSRIELTRVPNAVLYGSNSFNGVLHIKTKRKTERRVASLKYRNDEHGDYITGRYQDRFDNALVSLTVADKQVDGYEGLDEWTRSTVFTGSFDYEGELYDVGLQYKYSDGEFQGTKNEVLAELPVGTNTLEVFSSTFAYNVSDTDALELAYHYSKWNDYEYWVAEAPMVAISDDLRELNNLDGELARSIYYSGHQLAPDHEYFPIFMSAMAYGAQTGLFNGERYRFSLPIEVNEKRDSYRISYQHKTNIVEWAVGYTLNEELLSSPVYLYNTGKTHHRLEQIHGSASYYFDGYSLSASVMREESSIFDGHTQLRISGQKRLDDVSSLRFSASRSHRLPSIWEEIGGFHYDVDVEDNPYGIEKGSWWQEVRSEGGLTPEKNTHFEIGYHYANLKQHLEFDISTFYALYGNMLLDSTTLESFTFENDRDVEMYGIEAELSARMDIHNFKLSASYAGSAVTEGDVLIDSSHQYHAEDGGFTPKFKFNLLHSLYFSDSLNYSSHLGYVSDSSGLNFKFIKVSLSQALSIRAGDDTKLSVYVGYKDRPNVVKAFIENQITQDRFGFGGSLQYKF
jgi:iron complex outermembrane receptor protein